MELPTGALLKLPSMMGWLEERWEEASLHKMVPPLSDAI